jgi:hypothetical protein
MIGSFYAPLRGLPAVKIQCSFMEAETKAAARCAARGESATQQMQADSASKMYAKEATGVCESINV